ncbi:MAG: TolC family protein [Bacteroidetes bacterium]|nr:TolC family protein [Bacteroidota bacterium]
MKAKYKILLASILLLVGINNLFAQEEKIISLEEAIQLGIKNSKSLIVDQAKIDEALASYKKAKNNRLPDLKLSGSAMAMSKGKMNLEMMPNTGNSPKPNSAFMGSANFSFPIYAGGRIKNGIKTTEYLLEASKLSSENDKTAIAYNIAQVYNNLF